MTLQVITLGYCQLAGAFSAHSYCNKLELSIEADDLDVTVFGDSWSDHLQGIRKATLTLGGFNDYTDNLLDETMWGYFDAGTAIAFEVRPSSASVGAANPKYTGSVVPISWTPLGADVGQVSPLSVSWPVTGAVTRAVA